MPHDCLADFLETLHRAGQLLRVTAEVDPQLELAAITHAVAQQRGPAVLFQHVRGHAWPVVSNLLGSEARVALALGLDNLEQASERADQWLATPEPGTWLDRIKRTPAGADKLAPRQVKQAACQQVVKLGRDVDLEQLPVPRYWPAEARPTLSCGRVCWRDLDSGRLMLETLPVEIIAPNRVAIAWQQDAAFATSVAAASGQAAPLPVSVVVGGDPIYGLLTGRWPPQWCRLQLAARLRGRPLDMIRCRTQPLDVPADGDVVLEGYLDQPAESNVERSAASPLAGPSGHYLQPAGRHEMLVAAITYRTSPVLPAMVVGAGWHEALAIDQAVLTMLRPLIVQAVPDLVDYHAPNSAGWNPTLVVSIRKRHPGHARQAAAALWGLHVTSATRLMIIVDAEIDVRDMPQVMRAVGALAVADRDVWMHTGPAAADDPAGQLPGLGAHLAIDATAKVPGEHPCPWPPRVTEDSATRQLISQRWQEYGLPGKPQ